MEVRMNVWEYLVQIHTSQDWTAIVQVWGIVLACVIFVLLQLLLLRSRKLALRALDRVRELVADMQGIEGQLDEIERRVEGRFDSRVGELDARVTKKLDHKADLIEERIDKRASALSDAINKVESRASHANEEVARFRQELSDVESRIPGLFDKLDEFRETLGKTFQAELGSVLNSFDNSVSSVLQQMKSELIMGVSRIESIESMVRSRHSAERTLMSTPQLPEGEQDEEEEDEEEDEFAEWEEEAKELEADEEAAVEEREDEHANLRAVPVHGPDDEEDDGGDYPSEMVDEPEAADDELDEALFEDRPADEPFPDVDDERDA
jgi:chromosome segregation ATPase